MIGVSEKTRVHPCLASRLLNRETRVNGKPADTPGRSYLLLKELAKANGTEGSIPEDVARDFLTNPQSKFKVAGKRHWRELVKRGEGVFWTLGNGRLWLRSTAKVCKSLGIERLEGRAVELPITKLLGPIHKVRAVFYACDIGGRAEPKPISRKVQEKRTGVSRRRQKRYERVAKIKVKKHTAVMGDYSDYLLQRARYHFGKAAYNSEGKVKHQLPNSYHAPRYIEQLPRAKSKSLSFQIKRLNNAGVGTGWELSDKLYYDSLETAVSGGSDALMTYWQKRPGEWGVVFLSNEAAVK